MALDRQVELAMEAMQASHDAMLGHMALIREAMAERPDPSLPPIPSAFVPLQLEKSPPPGESLFQKGLNPPRKPPIKPEGEK